MLKIKVKEKNDGTVECNVKDGLLSGSTLAEAITAIICAEDSAKKNFNLNDKCLQNLKSKIEKEHIEN